MVVPRRALDDKKLGHLGFSHGSYLGNVYANLPRPGPRRHHRRVLDPIAWAGTLGNADVPQTARLPLGWGGRERPGRDLRAPQEAGPDYFMLASAGDPSGPTLRSSRR